MDVKKLRMKKARYFGQPFGLEFFDDSLKKNKFVCSVIGTYSGKVCFVVNIYVPEWHRRKGYASYVLDELKRMPVDVIRTEYHLSTKSGKMLFRNNNFKRDGEWLTWQKVIAS